MLVLGVFILPTWSSAGMGLYTEKHYFEPVMGDSEVTEK